MKSTTSARRLAEQERLDLIFGALSDSTRRALLARLSQAPAKVTELAEPFDMSLAAVSKHLGVLARAKLITRTADGRVMRCSLNAEALREADQWIAHYRVFWGETLDALAAFVEGDPEPVAKRRRPR